MSVTERLLADFLTQDEAAAELKVCERTLDRWRKLDDGPPITKLGRRILYRRSSLEAWLRGREYRGHLEDEPRRSQRCAKTVTTQLTGGSRRKDNAW